MLISLNWLKQYIELEDNIDIKELENALTMIGQEVEKIEKQGENLKDVLTAKIVEYRKHENSDHLTVCQVDNGKEILQVVCGASNHKQGDIVAMAQIGAKLEDDFIIKKGKIRGEESNGMLCSEEELKIGKNSNGIMILPEETKLGIPLNQYLGLNDTIFELEITPNRPDCLSHIGIARELSAYYNKELKIPNVNVDIKDNHNIDISIQENTSNRYLARVIKNVKVSPSPKWLKDKIEAIGLRSINNLVDISNYVMFETNQPNHIFDLDKLTTNTINIERAKEGEKFLTLDSKERILNSDDIVIKDGDKTIALAGVMGGLETEVTDNTQNILIEVAHFDNISVRKTSRRLALISDSSYRFERAVNTENMIYVMDRISSLIQEIAGGTICEINDKYPKPLEKKITEFSINRMNRFIGQEISKEKILDIFKRLEIDVEDKGDILILTAPYHRQDLNNQFDYFEEVIRLIGFDNIENVMPKVQLSKNRIEDTTKFVTDVKLLISSLGLREVINYSFIPKNSLDKIKYSVEDKEIIEIKNPIAEDFAIVRPTLMYSLIKNVKDNFNRSIQDMKFFEVSKRFLLEEVTKNDDNSVILNSKKISEKETLALILAGSKEKSLWNPKPENYDFYDMKGIVEEFFSRLKFNRYQIKRSINPSYHPGRSVDLFVGKELIATFGNLHPDVEENMDIEKINIIYGEVYLDILKKYLVDTIKYKGLSKYQSVPRDIALVVKEEVLVGDMIRSIEKIDKLVEKVKLFDIYRGIGIEKGYKSVAISILMRDENKTLEEKEITELVNKIIAKLEKEYGAKLR